MSGIITLDSVPEDVLFKFATNLSPFSILQWSQTSKLFYRICSQEHIWENISKEIFGGPREFYMSWKEFFSNCFTYEKTLKECNNQVRWAATCGHISYLKANWGKQKKLSRNLDYFSFYNVIEADHKEVIEFLLSAGILLLLKPYKSNYYIMNIEPRKSLEELYFGENPVGEAYAKALKYGDNVFEKFVYLSQDCDVRDVFKWCAKQENQKLSEIVLNATNNNKIGSYEDMCFYDGICCALLQGKVDWVISWHEKFNFPFNLNFKFSNSTTKKLIDQFNFIKEREYDKARSISYNLLSELKPYTSTVIHTCEINSKNITGGVEIGSGFFGKVYSSKWNNGGASISVALKSVAINNATEYTIHKSLHHPNIVECYGITTIFSKKYIVLELVKGKNLHELAIEEKPCCLVFQEKLEISRDIGHALLYVNKSGFYHNDVTLKNVLINLETKHTKICDFGISSSKEGKYCKSGVYSLDYPNDVFSFGLLLYELFVNQTVLQAVESAAKDCSSKGDSLHEEQIVQIWRQNKSCGKFPKIPELHETLVTLIESCWYQTYTSFEDIIPILDLLIMQTIVLDTSFNTRSVPSTLVFDH